MDKSARFQKPIINEDSLIQFYELPDDNLPDLLIEVIDLFISSSALQVMSISNFIKSADFINASKAAHNLKSGAQTLGALAFGEICQKIENFNVENNKSDLNELIDSLNNLHRQSCNELLKIRLKRENKLLRKTS